MKEIVAITLVLVILFTGCKNNQSESENNAENPNSLEYSELLKITKDDGYSKVDILTKATGKPVATYILVKEGEKQPEKLPEGEVIKVPVKSLVVNSSVYARPLQELGALEVIKGVTDASYFSIEEIRRGLDSGSIMDVGNSQSPTVEKIVQLNPAGILINLYEGMNLGELPTAGVPYIKMTDNLESTPLGRAEWIKFLGLLTGTEAQADSIFRKVKSDYTSLAVKVKDIKIKPKVLTDNMYEGVWYVPGGNSVAAKILADAGSEYPWADNKDTGSLALSYEEVLDKAGDADVWILKGFNIQATPKYLDGMDKRYVKFKAFTNRNVWFSDTFSSGLFDFTPFHPELLLSDYLSIIHPDVMENRPPRFFQKMAM